MKKKVNENTNNISSIKRVTKKFLKFHVVVVQNNGKEMYKKKCPALSKSLFLLIRPIVLFFTVLQRCLRRLALQDFIFCLNRL